MPETSETAGAHEGPLARALALVRGHGLWVLAAAAPFATVEVWRAFLGREAMKHALRVSPADVVLALLLAAAVASWAMRLVSARELAPPAAAWVLAGATALAAAMAPFGPLPFSPGATGKEVVQVVEIALVAWAVVRFAAANRRAVERAITAFALAATAHVVAAWVEIALGAHTFHVRGLMEHRNAFGCLMCVAAPVLVASGLAPGRRPPARAWLLATAALGLAGVTSGGLLAAGAVGVVTTGFALSPRRGLDVLAGVVAVVLLLQPVAFPRAREALLLSVSPYRHVRPGDGDSPEQPSMRTRRLQAAANCLREHRASGVGPGRFQDGIKRFYQPPYARPPGASDAVESYDVTFDEPGSQSLYEVAAVEGGLVGLLGMAAFLAYALASTAKRTGTPDLGASSGPPRPSPPGLAAGGLGAAVAVTLAGLFTSFMARGLAVPFVLVVALAGSSWSRGDRRP